MGVERIFGAAVGSYLERLYVHSWYLFGFLDPRDIKHLSNRNSKYNIRVVLHTLRMNLLLRVRVPFLGGTLLVVTLKNSSFSRSFYFDTLKSEMDYRSSDLAIFEEAGWLDLGYFTRSRSPQSFNSLVRQTRSCCDYTKHFRAIRIQKKGQKELTTGLYSADLVVRYSS